MAKPGYDYLVGGVTITNDITYADGSMTKQQLGGGLFALEGVRLWTDNVLYITNVGPDYEQYYGAWMRANGMSTEGANCCLQHTHYTDLYYRPDGTFTEVSKYSGVTFTGNGDYAVQAWQIEAVAEGVKGLYLDEHVRAGLWEELLTIRDRYGFKLMWEIPTRDLEDPQYYDEVRQLIKKVDLYSLNKPESFHFFGVDNEQDAIRKIMELGVPCFYRVGKKGSYMVADGQAAFAPSVDIGEPVDPTGCGNCSTASALYCWCEGCDPLMTAIMSNIAAAHNILQHGPYPQFTKQTEANARKLAEELYQKYKKVALREDGMKENKYDDPVFFEKYSHMARSEQGLAGAGEWDTLKRMLPALKGRRVLDLGCGYGWHCIYAAQHGAAEVTGIDLSEKMLRVAREKTRLPQVTYRHMAIEDAAFPAGSFDVVLSSLAFHYLSDFGALLNKVHSWLAPGGDFVFTVEHPVFTAYGTQDWYYDGEGKILHFPVDRYFEEGARQAVFLGEPVTKYHRTLTTYLGGLLEAGFCITGVAEPQPPERMLDIPGMRDELRRPMMLIMSAKKHG